MTNVIIIEDHQIVREGLKKIIAEAGEMFVAAEATNGADALALIDSQEYDLALLDLSLPGRNGLDVLKHIRKHKPKLPVLVISIYPEEDYGVRVLKEGASGYLSKESAAGDLVNAMRKVTRGEKFLSPKLADRLIGTLRGDGDAAPHEALSNREFQVFRLISSGKTVMDISREMSLSVKTISTYRMRILAKMKLKSNSDLIRYAVQHGLLDEITMEHQI